MKLALLAACAAAVFACTPPPKPPPPVADADADVTVVDASAPAPTDASEPDVGTCVAACRVLGSLGCPEAAGDAGTECLTVCVHTLDSPFDLKPECLAKATSVDEARACGTVRCEK